MLSGDVVAHKYTILRRANAARRQQWRHRRSGSVVGSSTFNPGAAEFLPSLPLVHADPEVSWCFGVLSSAADDPWPE
eukprot:1183412-Pyramimonas_sp.AAC.1